MSEQRLDALKSYQNLPGNLRSAVKLHLLYGVPGPKACLLAGCTNPARTWQQARIEQVISEYQNDIDAILADEPSAPTPISTPAKAQTRALEPPGATTEPKPAPEPTPKCTDCPKPACSYLGGLPYCADHFRTAYGLHPADSVKAIGPTTARDLLSDPGDPTDALGEALRAREAALDRKLQADRERSPHASMEKVFSRKGVPAEVLRIHPNARMATPEENEAAWRGFDQEQHDERESLISELRQQRAAADAATAQWLQRGGRL